MVTDKSLMEWYMKGFHDELYGTSTVESVNPLENKAYSIGSAHAIMGDDNRSFDELTTEQILEIIKR